MEFGAFRSNIEILDSLTSHSLRERYINQFVNTGHKLYPEQIEQLHQFIDGNCYLGYLWDYLKEPIVIDRDRFDAAVKKAGNIYVFWDIHTCERIVQKDYWRFGKEAVLKMKPDMLLAGLDYLPEDIYVFDQSTSWTLVKTHEEINGKPYCLAQGKGCLR